MFKRPLTIACLLVALLLCVLPLAHAQTTAAPTLLVKLVNGLSVDQQAAVIARIGGTEVSSIPALRLHVVAVPAAVLEAVFAAYQAGEISYEDALRNADSANDLRLQIKLNSQRARSTDLSAGTEHFAIV